MRLAIFDIDGTLTDSHGFDRFYFGALAERVGVPATKDSITGWTHVTDEGIVHEYFARHDRTPDAADFAWVKARYEASLAAHLKEVPPMPGAVEAFRDIVSHPDWAVAIATGNWGFAGERKLRAGGIDPAGVPLVGCDGYVSRTALMEHAVTQAESSTGQPFSHIVYVGDAAWDVAATRDLGWPFVGIHRSPERLEALGAGTVLTGYEDLPRFYDALTSAEVPGAPLPSAPSEWVL